MTTKRLSFTIELEIDVDLDAWATTYGIDDYNDQAVIADAINYYENCLADELTGAIARPVNGSTAAYVLVRSV